MSLYVLQAALSKTLTELGILVQPLNRVPQGGHIAGLSVNGSEFPYIPQWIVIFILLLMFSIDLYQNLWEQKVRKVAKVPVELGRRKR